MGSLEPDRIILYHSYSTWEVFYFSERGTRHNEKKFLSEEEACNYLYEKLKSAKETEDKYLK